MSPNAAQTALVHMMPILKRLVEQQHSEPEAILAYLTEPTGKHKLAAAYSMVCKGRHQRQQRGAS